MKNWILFFVSITGILASSDTDGLNYKQYELKIDIGNRYVISRIKTVIENTSEETKEFVSINKVPKRIQRIMY